MYILWWAINFSVNSMSGFQFYFAWLYLVLFFPQLWLHVCVQIADEAHEMKAASLSCYLLWDSSNPRFVPSCKEILLIILDMNRGIWLHHTLSNLFPCSGYCVLIGGYFLNTHTRFGKFTFRPMNKLLSYLKEVGFQPMFSGAMSSTNGTDARASKVSFRTNAKLCGL